MISHALFVSQGTRDELEAKLLTTCTLYVGNLAFYTTEEQIYELFSKAGDIKRVIMGLDRFKKTPCGFCFVEYPFMEKESLIFLSRFKSQIILEITSRKTSLEK